MKAIYPELTEELKVRSGQEVLASSSSGEIFEALSPQRINVIGWYPYKNTDTVLVLGGLSAAAELSEKVSCLDIFSLDKDEREFIKARFPNTKAHILSEYPDKEYDVIIDTCGMYKKALSGLNENGTLITVLENSGSLLLNTGAQRDSEKPYISIEELKSFINESGLPYHKLYFPLPNASFARDIKSTAILPEPGDFRDISRRFTGERFALCNDEALYDSIIKEDPALIERFAPSYLLVLSKNEQLLPDYIRYNRKRKPEYCIETRIYKGRYAQKMPLSEEAGRHIASFKDKYGLLLKTSAKGVTVSEPVITGEGSSTTAQFAFVNGRSLGKLLSEKISGGRAPEEEIKKYIEELIPEKCYNKDQLFDNFLKDGDRLTLIDYEWVSKEPVDPEFIKYRMLRYFYEDNKESLTAYRDLNDFLIKLGIKKDDLPAFEVKEEDFQLSVHGSDKGGFEDKFAVRAMDASQIKEMSKKLSRTERLMDEVSELKTALKKETEVERLSQNHIRNLENIIKARDAELSVSRGELLYLRKHESVPSRIKRKLIARLDAWAPAGSRRRMIIKYVKGTVFHPGTYLKRYFTEEGKLIRKGDFLIGGEFSEGGILTVPASETPLVSIVIPAYNQAAYTYACIRSICENTDAGVTPYEIILADDASTDATKEIELWIRNIKRAVTPGNLGFLKNCNNAAKLAAGNYILFLNNDTKVTKGWLSSLTELCEKDETIGLCGSKLIYPDGRLQEAGGIIWDDGTGWNYGRLDDPQKPQYNYVKEADYISGASIMIRKTLWEELGGFDERYAPAYCEDSDLAFSVRKAGKRVVYQPLSVVVHFEGISNGTDVNGTGLKRYQAVNLGKFREKWAAELKNQSVNTGNPDPFRARDRSQRKKTILIIDHYVPRRDQDAGSKTTYQYIKMFIDRGFNVKFLPDDFKREEPYAGELMQMGVEVLYGGDMRDNIFDWILKNKSNIDIAYLNRPHITVKYIDFLRENTKIKCIYYGHDLHYMRIGREFALTGDIRKRREADYWKSIEYQVMEQAHAVYYPSQDERDAILSENPLINVKAITAYIYEKPEEPGTAADYAKREGILFVGGFSHPPNADGVLWFLKDIWPRVHSALPSAVFYIAGSHPTEEILSLDGKDNVKVLGFVSDERLKELYHSTRLAAVPLRYGAGVKGKVIEALNEDSVVITTPVGAEGIPDAEKVMAVCENAESFADKLISLYNDEAALTEKSAECAPFIKRYYSPDAVWEKIARDFEV